MLTLLDVFLWRCLFVTVLIAALLIGAGLTRLAARFRARKQLPHARSMPATSARGTISQLAD